MHWLILIILVWGWIHSLLASQGVKSWFREKIGSELFRWYRLFYNFFSLVSALPIVWLLSILPDQNLYTVLPPWSVVIVTLQVIALLLLILGVFQTDALAFAGIRQLISERSEPLIKHGLYRIVRHPLYFFGLLFLWLTPSSSLNSIVLKLTFTVYLIAGAYFEEKKLLLEFGDEYLEYKRVTPMFIPRLF